MGGRRRRLGKFPGIKASFNTSALYPAIMNSASPL